MKKFMTFILLCFLSIPAISCPKICNCIGYDGIGGPAYKGIGGSAYDGIGRPCYRGIGGGSNCSDVCSR